MPGAFAEGQGEREMVSSIYVILNNTVQNADNMKKLFFGLGGSRP